MDVASKFQWVTRLCRISIRPFLEYQFLRRGIFMAIFYNVCNIINLWVGFRQNLQGKSRKKKKRRRIRRLLCEKISILKSNPVWILEFLTPLLKLTVFTLQSTEATFIMMSNVRNFAIHKGSQTVISCKLLNLVYVQS